MFLFRLVSRGNCRREVVPSRPQWPPVPAVPRSLSLPTWLVGTYEVLRMQAVQAMQASPVAGQRSPLRNRARPALRQPEGLPASETRNLPEHGTPGLAALGSWAGRPVPSQQRTRSHAPVPKPKSRPLSARDNVAVLQYSCEDWPPSIPRHHCCCSRTVATPSGPQPSARSATAQGESVRSPTGTGTGTGTGIGTCNSKPVCAT